MPMSAQTAPAAVVRSSTKTPIQHVIVIIGENRTFDHIFATYKPTIQGETIDNLLSKPIISEDGSPGPNYGLSLQFSAVDNAADKYQISPGGESLYSQLPPPVVGGYYNPPFSSLSAAEQAENGLAPDYYQYLLTGGTAPLQKPDIDTRIPGVFNLPPGPFQLTSYSFPYDAYANSPVHRFYQMWQQSDCNAYYATIDNPSGCNADLFPWVEVSVGASYRVGFLYGGRLANFHAARTELGPCQRNMPHLIGNTLEESAYHEAGHVVAAAVLGLALKPAGIRTLTVHRKGNDLGHIIGPAGERVLSIH